MDDFWKPGELIVWRGIYRQHIWHAQPLIVVKDSPEQTTLALLPGTECAAPEGYLNRKKEAKRRWDFKDRLWKLETYSWHTNRLLFLLEPEKYYSTILFWNHQSNQFLCYYINFQVPYRRSRAGIDTLDLDLDLIIRPDLHYEWKDLDDYEQAIAHGIICTGWIQGIERAKIEILNQLEHRWYPFDGSWLDWMPDPSWSPRKLPRNWDKI